MTIAIIISLITGIVLMYIYRTYGRTCNLGKGIIAWIAGNLSILFFVICIILVTIKAFTK